MQKYLLLLFIPLALGLTACEPETNGADAYGNFEVREIIVSAEANGKILLLDVEEGQTLQAGQLVALIDTVPLHLQKQQLLAGIQTVHTKTQDAQPQIEVLEEQKANLLREKKRVEALLADKAATPKQLDDINGQIEVVDKQIAAARSQTSTLNRGILGEIGPIREKIKLIEDQIRRCYVYNPMEGVVLLKLAEPTEMTAAGRPLYKIADLSEMELRAYVSGAQLPEVKIGQEVEVRIDQGVEGFRSLNGQVSWIASQAEFTPKTIQTKEERVNLVYAIKVKVPNDGSLKIGMPGEVIL
jgi:HlyD family secretion protein